MYSFLLGGKFSRCNLVQLRILRGLITALIGTGLLVIGTAIFDSAYGVVESVMGNKQDLFEDKMISPGEFINHTITWNDLATHSVLVVDATPLTNIVKLQVNEPGGSTFEKESKNGFVYHIIGKNAQNQGDYDMKVYNIGTESVTVNVILGEDPYLSGKCSSENQTTCYAIPAAIGIVIAGMLSLIIGSIVFVSDIRKKKKSA